MMFIRYFYVLFVATISILSCSKNNLSLCESSNYSSWKTSEYILPYPIGTEYEVAQGNCTPEGTHWHWNSHTSESAWAFAYDFLMPIGSIITSIGDGEVVWLRKNNSDNSNALGEENAIIIRQSNNTFVAYSHLTFQGVFIEVGDYIDAGDTIGLSGNSGLSMIPHLHLQLSPCLDPEQCGSLPLTFRNTTPNPIGLLMGEKYKAFEF